MEQSEAGLVAATDGWFAVNVRDAAWVTTEAYAPSTAGDGPAGALERPALGAALVPGDDPGARRQAERRVAGAESLAESGLERRARGGIERHRVRA